MHLFFHFLLSVLLLPFSVADPRITPSLLLCSVPSAAGTTTGAAAANSSSFVPTFVSQMSHLSKLMSSGRRFATTSAATFHALAQCHGDLSQTDCLLCFAAARTLLPRCISSPSALLFLDGCFLRYSASSPTPFFSQYSDPHIDRVNCTSPNPSPSDSVTPARKGFEKVVEVVTAVGGWQAGEGGYGAAEYRGFYTMGQCWGSLDKGECVNCLQKAAKEVVEKCAGRARSEEGRGLFAGCYLRYSAHKFYNDKNGEGGGGGGNHGECDVTEFRVFCF